MEIDNAAVYVAVDGANNEIESEAEAGDSGHFGALSVSPILFSPFLAEAADPEQILTVESDDSNVVTKEKVTQETEDKDRYFRLSFMSLFVNCFNSLLLFPGPDLRAGLHHNLPQLYLVCYVHVK